MAGHMIDIANDDVWGVVSITNALNEPVEGQSVPNVLDDLWTEESVDTRSVFMEKQGEELALVPAVPYGGVGDQTTLGRASGETFDLIYLPTGFGVAAHELQGVRQFGSDQMATLELKRDQKLAKCQRRIEGTRRFHQAKAVFEGKIYDANGSRVIIDLNDRFGLARQTHAIALSVTTTSVKARLELAKDLAIDALGDSTGVNAWRLYAGRNYHAALVGHSTVEEAFKWATTGQFNTQSQANRPFVYADIEIYKFYGQMKNSAGSGTVNWIDPDKAYLVPITDDPGYMTFFGPAPYFETVNTMGLPWYGTILEQNAKGLTGEVCTFTLSLPRRPRSIIELTKS